MVRGGRGRELTTLRWSSSARRSRTRIETATRSCARSSGRCPAATSARHSFAASLSILREVGVLLHELRDPAGGEAGPVGPHQQLAVAVRTGADADGRDVEQLLGDLRARHPTAPSRARRRTRRRPRTAWASASSCCGALAAALDDVAAEPVLALRGEADVRHHRDAGADDAADLLGAALAALELDRVRAGLLHEPDRGVQRVVRPGLVGAERHVGDDERALHGAGDRAGRAG